MRKAGILMPVFSLPNQYGCGDFGKEAFTFVDLMKKAGLTIWQILPLNPLGEGNSPYQPFSSFAMDEIYISLDLLKKEKLIKNTKSFHAKDALIDYDAVRAFKEKYLKEAYENFKENKVFQEFSKEEWVIEYAIYRAIRKNHEEDWTTWSEEEKTYATNLEVAKEKYSNEIKYQIFLQYILKKQWDSLKAYANKKGIQIMGDIPFYVGLDSSDVFFHQEQFLLDEDGRPSFIAGVPPDYFAAEGQRWGNPIYDWHVMEKDGFRFWIDRLSFTRSQFDIVRVDHFRAFDTYWKIPSSCPTAVDGEWAYAPGYALFDALFKAEPGMEIVAEDLGFLRSEVYELRDHYNFRGMRVVQFTLPPEEDWSREHLIVYTGTHDNDAILSWYHGLDTNGRKKIRDYLKMNGFVNKSVIENLIDYTLQQNADIAILPMADWIHAQKNARINTPGTMGSPNWCWRLTSFNQLIQQIPNMKKRIKGAKRI